MCPAFRKSVSLLGMMKTTFRMCSKFTSSIKLVLSAKRVSEIRAFCCRHNDNTIPMGRQLIVKIDPYNRSSQIESAHLRVPDIDPNKLASDSIQQAGEEADDTSDVSDVSDVGEESLNTSLTPSTTSGGPGEVTQDSSVCYNSTTEDSSVASSCDGGAAGFEAAQAA
jgi:hypothetical protein